MTVRRARVVLIVRRTLSAFDQTLRAVVKPNLGSLLVRDNPCVVKPLRVSGLSPLAATVLASGPAWV